jgi:hypothetical protein
VCGLRFTPFTFNSKNMRKALYSYNQKPSAPNKNRLFYFSMYINFLWLRISNSHSSKKMIPTFECCSVVSYSHAHVIFAVFSIHEWERKKDRSSREFNAILLHTFYILEVISLPPKQWCHTSFRLASLFSLGWSETKYNSDLDSFFFTYFPFANSWARNKSSLFYIIAILDSCIDFILVT